MPTRSSPGGSPTPAHGHRRFLLVAALPVAVATVLCALLQWSAARSRHHEMLLARVQAGAYRISALEWQASAMGEVEPAVSEGLATARRAVASALDELRGSRATDPDVRQVSKRYREYAKHIDHEFELFRAGAMDEAREYDETAVDPAFEELHGAIDVAAARVAREAGLAGAIGLWGTVLGVFAALATVAWLQSRSARAALEMRRTTLERELAEERSRHLESANRQLEEANAGLAEATRLKSEFLANMSHELRTPLTAILGYTELVADGLCDNRDEERRFLQQTQASARHLLALIGDLLDIARIESGRFHLEVEALDVTSLLEEVREIAASQAEAKNLAFEIIPPDPAYRRVRADALRTRQVLLNVVVNAIKFTEHGHVRVRAEALPERGFMRFEVVDTGVGVPPDKQAQVFDRFTQADSSSTRRFGGTGLGLTISRELIEMMGGIISLQSRGEGQGTRVAFTLPLAVPAETAAPDAELLGEVQGPDRGPLVLVVEDEPVTRGYVCRQLRAHGYRTVETNSAEEGWVLATRLLPAVVCLDYALPSRSDAEMRTGWDLATRLTMSETTRHIPLVFVTGLDSELRERLTSTAFAREPRHVIKPIDAGELVRQVHELVRLAERPSRALLADDDPAVGAFIRKLLGSRGVVVEVVTDGGECLRRLKHSSEEIGLLLLDLQMPGVSGYDVLREMTLRGTGREVPVVVLTNNPEPANEDERRLLEDGLVLEVVPKSAIHANRDLLARVVGRYARPGTLGSAGDDLREAA